MQRFPIVLIVLGALISLWSCQRDEPLSNKEARSAFAPDQPRVSLTFILGEDGTNGNRFYQKAGDYYRVSAEKTDDVVYSCQSLAEVKSYLEHFPQPLSLINLVSHGNPWQGLSVPVLEDGKRCSYSNLAKALDQDQIGPIESTAIDQETEINIISCGIGQDEELVVLLNQFFGRKAGQENEVKASEYYVNFSDQLEKYESKFYFTTSKYEYADLTLIPNRLSQKYPKVAMDWRAAYANTTEAENADPFRYTFRMAVNWTVRFEDVDDLKKIQSEATLVEWMQTQPALIDALATMRLTFNDFQWSYFRAGEDSLKICGFCNVDGVMKKV